MQVLVHCGLDLRRYDRLVDGLHGRVLGGHVRSLSLILSLHQSVFILRELGRRCVLNVSRIFAGERADALIPIGAAQVGLLHDLVLESVSRHFVLLTCICRLVEPDDPCPREAAILESVLHTVGLGATDHLCLLISAQPEGADVRRL